MNAFIFFMIGVMLGGLAGIVTMCLLQINRLHREIERKDENYEDEKHSEDCTF